MGDLPLCCGEAGGSGPDWLTPDLAKVLASKDVGFDHTVSSACLILSGSLLSEEDLPHLILLLQSPDRGVVVGASMLCRAVGLPARPAEPILLRLLTTGTTDEVRASVVLALGALGSESIISDLNTLARKDEGERIKDGIIETTKAICLSDPTKW